MNPRYPKFLSASLLNELIEQYFCLPAIHNEIISSDALTITGLALHLGFVSLEQFEDYEINGKYAADVKRSRLRIECVYEKKLHLPSPAGAIFALKSMGWHEKAENKKINKTGTYTIKVTIVETGPKPASVEKEVSF